MMRTHYCGALNRNHIGQEVTLSGWVHRRRDLGGLIFIDMRDRDGIVQVCFDPKYQEALTAASGLRNEFCIQIKGEVIARPDNQVNKNMATGEVEVLAKELRIYNASDVLPLDFNQNNTEEQRLKYRYLDLRRPEMAQRLKTRAKITSFVRRFMDDNGFLDIETPMLTKATPEGARDYLVPSRVHKGKFYALPQSPQLFKQLLIAVCYRNIHSGQLYSLVRSVRRIYRKLQVIVCIYIHFRNLAHYGVLIEYLRVVQIKRNKEFRPRTAVFLSGKTIEGKTGFIIFCLQLGADIVVPFQFPAVVCVRHNR